MVVLLGMIGARPVCLDLQRRFPPGDRTKGRRFPAGRLPLKFSNGRAVRDLPSSHDRAQHLFSAAVVPPPSSGNNLSPRASSSEQQNLTGKRIAAQHRS
jgi:hypothetical protein